jgi:hypothetical protein
MARETRKKASEVDRERFRPFARKVGFKEAFPEIEDVRVEVAKSGAGIDEWNNHAIYGKEDLGEYIDCSNSLCYDGGFSIGAILRDMVSKKQMDLETSQLCQGNEGSPKGRRIYRKCVNYFKVKVSIKYKNVIEQPA